MLDVKEVRMAGALLLYSLFRGCLYAISAAGFALVYNTTGTLHVLHGAIFISAGYGFFWAFAQRGWPWPVALLVALLLAVLLGCASEWLVYRPLRRRRASSEIAFVASLGAFIMVVNALALHFGTTGQTVEVSLQAPHHWGSIVVTGVQQAQMLALVLVAVALAVIFRTTFWGRLLRGARDNALLLEVLGFNLDRIRLGAFAAGALLAGLAGLLAALDTGVEPYGGFTLLVYSAVAVIVGGVGVFHGALLGGMLVGLVQGLVAWKLASGWEEAAVFVTLLLVLLVRPQGLLGRPMRPEEV